ncbi:MAG: cytochrome o ubiquinol oxidase subunit 1 [Francisellaceae bacterium]
MEFSIPMMYTIAFLVTFTVGGMTGVILSVPGVDFQMHNSLFLIAHFHNTIIGGVAFGMFAGVYYWAPKIFGFRLHEGWGKAGFWCWAVGFYVAFMPLYILGLMGMTRRLEHYPAGNGWHPFLIVAACGAVIILFGIAAQVISVIVAILQRKKLKDTTGDPWDGRTLEWSIPSPAPFYNFAHTPVVEGIDPFWEQKQKDKRQPKEKVVYEDIHMPRNTSIGFLIGVIGGVFGFAMIWEMSLLAAVTGVAIIALVIARSFNFNTDYYVKASEVKEIEESYNRGAQ